MLFGDVRISLEELAKRLCQEIREKVNAFGPRPRNQNWTECVMKVLHRHGNALKYEVLCQHIEGCHEWLLDLIWWKNEPEIGIALAVECEWGGTRDIIDDFQKLLCTKAPLKVLIYDGGNIPKHGDDVQAAIKNEMKIYHHHVAGETYLFLAFGDRQQYCHRFVVPRDGVLEEINFELLIDAPAASMAAPA